MIFLLHTKMYNQTNSSICCQYLSSVLILLNQDTDCRFLYFELNYFLIAHPGHMAFCFHQNLLQGKRNFYLQYYLSLYIFYIYIKFGSRYPCIIILDLFIIYLNLLTSKSVVCLHMCHF